MVNTMGRFFPFWSNQEKGISQILLPKDCLPSRNPILSIIAAFVHLYQDPIHMSMLSHASMLNDLKWIL